MQTRKMLTETVTSPLRHIRVWVTDAPMADVGHQLPYGSHHACIQQGFVCSFFGDGEKQTTSVQVGFAPEVNRGYAGS